MSPDPVAEILSSAAFHLSVTVFLGLCLGSFATALAYRLPRDISIVGRSRSHCVSCDRALGFPDLVPVFSWVLLKGKCRACRASIGWQYPAIEVATLALCLVFYKIFGFSPVTLAMFALAPVLVSIIDIDFRHKIIPDGLNMSVFLIGVAAFLASAFQEGLSPDMILRQMGTALLGVFMYGGGSLLLRQGCMKMMKREPMGLGDVKFFAAAGFWLGTGIEAFSWFMLLAGGLGVVLALVWKKIAKEAEFPFGPCLVLAFIAVLLLSGPGFINM